VLELKNEGKRVNGSRRFNLRLSDERNSSSSSSESFWVVVQPSRVQKLLFVVGKGTIIGRLYVRAWRGRRSVVHVAARAIVINSSRSRVAGTKWANMLEREWKPPPAVP
jgi:hypothetical protein